MIFIDIGLFIEYNTYMILKNIVFVTAEPVSNSAIVFKNKAIKIILVAF